MGRLVRLPRASAVARDATVSPRASAVARDAAVSPRASAVARDSTMSASNTTKLIISGVHCDIDISSEAWLNKKRNDKIFSFELSFLGERERTEDEVRRRRDDYERRRQVTNSSPDAIDSAMRSNFAGGTQAIGEAEDEPLPEGWDMQIAPNGRTFFIDHRTKTTTWLDPRTGIAASRPVSGKTDDEIGALPEGWEQRDPRFENESIAGPAIPYSRDYKRKVRDILMVDASS
ncbi:WW domain protein [Teladorsagia circumcincta]|uniref:WW domain protein n=1 Tax=Teladorsagia circumcincta TaxID=45464 RepID=A0A2G9U9V8_TELCI|nr:WW domain protein [Teladorsagia circumcincta]